MTALRYAAVPIAIASLITCVSFVNDYWQISGYSGLGYALGIVACAASIGGFVSVGVLLWRRV